MSGTSCTVAELIEGHIALEIDSLDRIYLNGYVPNLQVGGQVVSFLVAHLALARQPGAVTGDLRQDR